MKSCIWFLRLFQDSCLLPSCIAVCLCSPVGAKSVFILFLQCSMPFELVAQRLVGRYELIHSLLVSETSGDKALLTCCPCGSAYLVVDICEKAAVEKVPVKLVV